MLVGYTRPVVLTTTGHSGTRHAQLSWSPGSRRRFLRPPLGYLSTATCIYQTRRGRAFAEAGGSAEILSLVKTTS
jgi:hypothetical protein